MAGHAAYGNLHFILTPRLDDPADLGRYSAFMDGLAALVIDKYDGSLKAEHGTGATWPHSYGMSGALRRQR